MPQKLPYDEFLKTFEKVPRVAISLFIENSNKEVLLAKRAISPGENTWHLPGSFILKGERIKDCIKRILENELGFQKEFTYKVANVFEDLDKDPRGHVIDMVYRVEATSDMQVLPTLETKEAMYFKSLPEHIGFNHLEVLHRLGR